MGRLLTHLTSVGSGFPSAVLPGAPLPPAPPAPSHTRPVTCLHPITSLSLKKNFHYPKNKIPPKKKFSGAFCGARARPAGIEPATSDYETCALPTEKKEDTETEFCMRYYRTLAFANYIWSCRRLCFAGRSLVYMKGVSVASPRASALDQNSRRDESRVVKIFRLYEIYYRTLAFRQLYWSCRSVSVSSTGMAYMKGVRRGIVTCVVCVLCVRVFLAEYGTLDSKCSHADEKRVSFAPRGGSGLFRLLLFFFVE